MATSEETWVPQACTLPTPERPLRVAEFDQLFATALRGQQRLSPTELRWELDPDAEPMLRDLTSRETACCSFFIFTISPGTSELRLDVRVPANYVQVLDGLAARATAGMAG
ncbi:hypothetical protein [Rugosimonospora africana]|uniref:Uncharacterized protein n=1 Tax=Rugosimonospora africana TaxID=556532 RepID=A0A8J3VVX8_9ACTN|nr:hypothetical protein [Rugosimonospora africana]GIH20800.1 hypothetical protein Raf01_89720 [Rugosimonospora africana]